MLPAACLKYFSREQLNGLFARDCDRTLQANAARNASEMEDDSGGIAKMDASSHESTSADESDEEDEEEEFTDYDVEDWMSDDDSEPNGDEIVLQQNQLRRRDPTILILAANLRRHTSKLGQKEFFKLSEAIQCTCCNCPHGLETSEQKVDRLYEELSENLQIRTMILCNKEGHNTVLRNEWEECAQCPQITTARRGDEEERLKIVWTSVRAQLENILQRLLSHIIDVHKCHHDGSYLQKKREDFSPCFGEKIRRKMETQADFQQKSITVQLVLFADGFRARNNSSGSAWGAYGSIYDLPDDLRNCASNMINMCLMSSGSKTVGENRLQLLWSQLEQEVAAWGMNPLRMDDENGSNWKIYLECGTSLMDMEAYTKVYLHPSWNVTGGIGNPFGGCVFGDEVPVYSNGYPRFQTIPGNCRMRATAQVVHNAANLRFGFRGLTPLMRMIPSTEALPDLLHTVYLGVFREIDCSIASGGRWKEVRVVPGPIDVVHTIRMPTGYGTRLRSMKKTNKTASELCLVSMTTNLVYLISGKTINIRTRPLGTTRAAAASLFWAVVLLTFRRLLEKRVPELQLRALCDDLEQLGAEYQRLFGVDLTTPKVHVFFTHIPNILRSTGNLTRLDCAHFEHYHQYIKDMASPKDKNGWLLSFMARSVVYKKAVSVLHQWKVGQNWERNADWLLANIGGGIRGSSPFSNRIQITSQGRATPVIPLCTPLVRIGCTRFFREICLDGITLASHERPFGKTAPPLSQKNNVVIKRNGVKVFCKLLAIGAVGGDMSILVDAHTVIWKDMALPLLALASRDQQNRNIVDMFDSLVRYSYIVLKDQRCAPLRVVFRAEEIVGQFIEIPMENKLYFVHVPDRNRAN